MNKILTEQKQYPYLMKHAIARLKEVRDTAKTSGMLESNLINLGGKMWCLFPWTGTYAFLALERLIKIKCAKRIGLRGFNSSRPYFMQFAMDVSKEEFLDILVEEANKDFDPLELVYPNEVPVFDKYDEYLPDELVRKEFAHSILDIEEMRKCVNQLQ